MYPLPKRSDTQFVSAVAFRGSQGVCPSRRGGACNEWQSHTCDAEPAAGWLRTRSLADRSSAAARGPPRLLSLRDLRAAVLAFMRASRAWVHGTASVVA